MTGESGEPRADSTGAAGSSEPDWLRDSVRARIEAFASADVVGRIWAKDHTVWRPDPKEITDRLGWLTVHDEMRAHVDDLRTFARGCWADGFRTAVLAGMGGSSLAPEVFRSTFGAGPDGLDLIVLDTTHPDQILEVERSLDLDRTLFVISSKSGTTLETRSHFAHFWDRFPKGASYVAITDPGTPLVGVAEEHGFRRVFHNPPDIGGRYSALSYFGLVPAALVGADTGRLTSSAAAMARTCGPETPAAEHPGLRLGIALGEAALAGRDKLAFVLPSDTASLGAWIEQLIAESTGKEGRGIVPIEGATLGPPGVYGNDRIFAAAGDAGGRILEWLARAGHPVERVSPSGREHLGAQMFLWEFATAVAGAVLGIHPFDQPDVQAAKDATAAVLKGGEIPPVDRGDLGAILHAGGPPHYLAIQAYLARTAAVAERLTSVRERIRDHLRMATTVGFGPRFLHSTGQLHKGGPPTGLFVQVVEPPRADVPIPGEDFTFGKLLAAQAAGDLQALRDRGRPVARVDLSELERATARLA
ncbi:MAG: glucose-6-phosphate isomerase [Actinomycetota bacterium]|nr:glucose-6-phosphate isomerase [Actinomycetota bacterium]